MFFLLSCIVVKLLEKSCTFYNYTDTKLQIFPDIGQVLHRETDEHVTYPRWDKGFADVAISALHNADETTTSQIQ